MALIRGATNSPPLLSRIRRQLTLDADAVHDAMHAVRMLVKAPAFTAIVLFVFAIGIGSTTAMVSIADALFLRALPVSQPERVMTLWQHNRDTGTGSRTCRQPMPSTGSSAPARRARLGPWPSWNRGASIHSFPDTSPSIFEAARVSEQFFALLGTPMLHGRAFLPQEHRGAGRFAILSFPMWRDRFGADPSVVGRAVQLDQRGAATIVGVLPHGFELRLFDGSERRPEPWLWLPKQGFEEFEPRLRGSGALERARPASARGFDRRSQRRASTLSDQLARMLSQTNKSTTAHVLPLRTYLVGSFRAVLPLLLGAAVVLLIVACANVANLLLARGVARGREFEYGRHWVRAASGWPNKCWSKALLAIVGGTLGLALARWTLDVIARLRPMDVARVDQIPIDMRRRHRLRRRGRCGDHRRTVQSIQLSRPVSASASRWINELSQRSARRPRRRGRRQLSSPLAPDCWCAASSRSSAWIPDSDLRVAALQIFPRRAMTRLKNGSSSSSRQSIACARCPVSWRRAPFRRCRSALHE